MAKSRARGRARTHGKSGRAYGARGTTTREKVRSYGTQSKMKVPSTTTTTTPGLGSRIGAGVAGVKAAGLLGSPKKSRKRR